MGVFFLCRMQSFPDDFQFFGDKQTEAWKHIGNAVPIGLATAIAKTIRASYRNISNEELADAMSADVDDDKPSGLVSSNGTVPRRVSTYP
jgi:C-5 cytosine-specific DNA methylase